MIATLRTIASRIRGLFSSQRVDDDFEQELEAHLALLTEENIRAGMSSSEAARAARLRLGGAVQLRESHHDQLTLPWLESFAQDIRFAMRMLRKNPGFTAVAVLTLALGIGASTAIFSMVNAAVLRPLPYKDAGRLITIWNYNRQRGFDMDQVSPLDFADWRSQNHVFQDIAASTEAEYTLTGAGEPALIIAYSFSADYFRVLGVAPILGRTFLPDEEQPGKNHVAVLNYSFWQERFGGNHDVVGSTIELNGASYTVIGVMPPGFEYPTFTKLWTPLTIPPEAANNRGFRYLRVLGRLKPGVTVAQAQAEMNTIAARLASEYPTTNKHEDATNLITLREMISGDIRPAMAVLLCAVGFVLLIVCANVANLLLARAAGRRREVVVRVALGAGRSRLVRQFFTESLLLATIGGGAGLLLGYFALKPLATVFPNEIFNVRIPPLAAISIDWHVLVFAAAVSLFTCIIFGLAPAIQACAADISEPLKSSSRGVSGGAHDRRLRNSLVVAEIAISLLLLTCAGLALQSFRILAAGNLGFEPAQVLTMRVLLPENKYKTDAQQSGFAQQAFERIQALPGVRSAGVVTFLPLSGWNGSRSVGLVDSPVSADQRPIASWSAVTPDYFGTLAIPVLRGRTFTPEDDASSQPVAIVSENLARRLAPTPGDAIGKQIEVNGIKGALEVVGVVGNIHQLGLMTASSSSQLYLPFAQQPTSIVCFAIRTGPDVTGLAKSAEAAIWSIDKDQSIGYVMPMAELASNTIAPQRVVAILLALFAAIALVMAAVGIYGVISYSVSQRTREIGIRMALGAGRGDILRMAIREGLRLALSGIAIGIASGLFLTRLLSSVLYGISPSDPRVFAVVTTLLGGVALFACYVPARRAARVDPLVALRHE